MEDIADVMLMVGLKKLFLLLRVSHWSKAIFVLLGVIYAGLPSYWHPALIAALAFCLIASAVYIYNDLQDIEEDRLHPRKQRRPIASEEISISFALSVLAFLLLSGLILGFTVSSKLAAILGIYLLVNLVYNHWLRHVPVFDVVCVAVGFMLRILAGTIGIGLPITWWLMSAATLLSLFMALSKRRLEMQLGIQPVSRAVLKKYHPHLLDALLNVTAISSFITYLFYTVYARDESFYFLLTLPFAAFGLWRFLRLMAEGHEHDDPVFILLGDNLSQLNLFCFFGLTFMALV